MVRKSQFTSLQFFDAFNPLKKRKLSALDDTNTLLVNAFA